MITELAEKKVVELEKKPAGTQELKLAPSSLVAELAPKPVIQEKVVPVVAQVQK